MNPEKSVTSELLEEVFNEVECLDNFTEKESSKLEFLEDVVKLEKESLHSIGKSRKKKFSLEQLNWTSNPKQKESIVHEGFTDSSDDEDNKYFEESSYNSCGRNLKSLIKNKTNSNSDCTTIFKSSDFSEKTKPTGENLKTTIEKTIEKNALLSSENAFCSGSLLRDPILGMNIINPLVSSITLKEKLIGRISISTSKVKHYLETSDAQNSNWITGGAIVSKFTKTSRNGNPYCVWHVTDLIGDIKTICIFLFGSAYKEHWKNPLGTVVGILNPAVMESKEKTLRVDNAQKILIMGMSKDYGVCKSKKKNGENCLSVVNKSKCDYCIYHMKKEYVKACKRSDLQPPKIGRNLNNLRAKILGKKQIYNARAYSEIPCKRNSKLVEKDKQRLKLLSQNQVSKNESLKTKTETPLKTSDQSFNPILAEKICTPTLPKPEFQMINLAFNISKKERNTAKANALKYIREHGPIKKLTENDKTKKTLEQISAIKRRLETEKEEVRKKIKVSDGSSECSLKKKYLKNGITSEFFKLMNSESRNNEILKEAETEEREKYFNKLEVREKLETKMILTFKVDCKAVRCLKCNYKAFSASDLCKKQQHPLKVINAVKRFWKCGKCSARTVCLELVPLHSCKICGSSKWEKTSMMPEKKDMNLTRVPLSLRGDEEKFLGASLQTANLNLLVPEFS